MRGLRNDIVDGIGNIIHIQQGAVLIHHCPGDVIAVSGIGLKSGQAGAWLYQRDPYPGRGQFPPQPFSQCMNCRFRRPLDRAEFRNMPSHN